MPRHLKPFLVETVSNAHTGVDAGVYLDRETKTFFAMVGPTRVEAPTAEECIKKARELLRDYRGLTWERCIRVETEKWSGTSHYSSHEQTVSNISLRFHRFKRAMAPGGTQYVELTWEDDETRLDFLEARFHNSFSRYGEDEIIIPYTDKAWEVLNEMKKRIDGIHTQLSQLLTKESAEKVLNSATLIKLLPEGPRKLK